MAEINYQNIVDAYAKAINDAEVAALLFLEGKIKFRVHNRGQKSEGDQIGTYRPFTIKKRKERGRQVNYVDLQFEGNLIKGYKVGKASDNNANALGFINDVETQKAVDNEQRFGGPIFSPPSSEIDAAMQSYTAVLNAKLKDALQ
jgi:hypothetical protein